MKTIAISLLVIVLIATSALFFFQDSDRIPSSIKSGKGNIPIFSALSNDETKKLIKRHILGALEWEFAPLEMTLSLQLGNLKIQSSQSTNDLCVAYPVIITVFESPEVSYSGEHPEFSVRLPCDPSQLVFELDFLKTKESIKKGKPEVDIQLNNWENEIPELWRIKRIYFSAGEDSKNNSLDLTKYEILALLGRPIEFKLDMKAN